MGYSNAYNAYQKTNINTASQGRLVVLLYEGIIKQLTTAGTYIENDGKIRPENIEKYGICIQKAQAIITDLQVSLDMDKGGEIALNLMSLYVFFNEELLAANINHNKDKLDFVLRMVKDLTESWIQIANSVANAPAATVQNALNIQG